LTNSVRHLAIVGPTASGKSDLALAMARACGDVELVSLDSMQVYRGMDVGTAKPSTAELAEVPHHLVDVADPGDDWSVARTQRLARDAVRDIEARGRRAVLVGGTGLYVQAVVDDHTLPGEDLRVRAELDAWTSEPGGLAAAWREQQRVDPLAASRIEEHNQRRIVRALEVFRVTGRPFSSFGPGIDRFGEPVFPVTIAGVWLPRDVLAARIMRRFTTMRERGLVDEVRALVAHGPLSRTARQAIGYKEVLAALDGTATLDEAFGLAVRRTRSFARQQRMWFRRDPRIRWFGTGENPSVLRDAILATWSANVSTSEILTNATA
jgi:tRNA dimethylallyltransferase